MNRVDPFGDLADFAPKPKAVAKSVAADQIDQLAVENGFPSRQPGSRKERAKPPEPAVKAVRRYTTGRNRQLNLKASDETINRFYRLADVRGVSLAEMFELAVQAAEATPTK